jgi:hypothetical protein
MRGLTRAEWRRIRRTGGVLVIITAIAVTLYGALGKTTEVLTLPTIVLAVVSVAIGGIMRLFHHRMVNVMSAMIMPLCVATGAGIGIVIAELLS